MPYDDRNVSYGEFDRLRSMVYAEHSEFKTDIAVLKKAVAEQVSSHAQDIPAWLQLTVGLGFPTIGLILTLFLTGRL